MANKEINEKIRKFKNDPIYGQCYDSILEQIAFFAKTYEKIDISLAICEIFETTDEYVNRVVTADIPEIEINNITSEICWSHKEPTTRTNGMLISTLTPIKIIGSFIEMLFIVKVFDTIENKDKSIMNALHNCRMHCENYNLSHFYTRSDIWKLIAERIIPDSPRIREDYEQLYLKQKSICEKQEKEIE